MHSTLSPLRSIGATLVIAGVAGFGAVAVAPAASAGPAHSASTEVGTRAEGLVASHRGDDDINTTITPLRRLGATLAIATLAKPKKHSEKCQPVVVGGDRF